MTVTIEPGYVGDDLNILVTVLDKNDQPVDLAGATADAVVHFRGTQFTGKTTISGTVPGGVYVEFGRKLQVGTWQVQVRVTRGGIRQTVLEATYAVKPMIFAV